jgi:hypothetical protein
MTIKYHPICLIEPLEALYQALVKRSVDGVVVGCTPRMLMEDLGLDSPAPLMHRIESLVKMNVIGYAPLAS